MRENSGRKFNQKMKAYLVMQYLLKNSDENHAVPASQIVGYLQEAGIEAERRSIYRDIDEINTAMLMVENDLYLDEAQEQIEKYGDNARYIVYDANKKGYYIRERRYEFDEIRLAAESIYSSKFLTEAESDTFVDLICSFVSDYQAEQIRHDVLLTDRVKTNNRYTFRNVSTISSAMSKELDGEKHIPEKISFKYLKSTINDLKQQAERRQGARYSVSPYALLLNDGNYYLLAFDDYAQDMRTYRVDRMRDIRLSGQPRDGEDVFANIDMKSYTQRVFSMFSGTQEKVSIQFTNNLLDPIIDRFGIGSGVIYSKVDDNHFSIYCPIEISNQFFGWISGFGNQAKIISPPELVDKYTVFLKQIISEYRN